MKKVIITCQNIAAKIQNRFCSPCSPRTMVPLSRLCRSGRITVCKVNGDRKLCARIGALGIYPGAKAELICASNGSQCILQLYGSRLCLDRTITENILVSEY